MSALYKQLDGIRLKLEQHYQDMQDIEFTIQEGKLYMLQCRNGKRTGTAALNMAMDMLDEKLIDEKTAVMRVEPAQLDELLHPIVDPTAEKKHTPDHQGPARRPRRRARPDRLHLRGGGELGGPGQEGDPRPRGDQPRGRRRNARRAGHPHRARRHDQPCGPRGPRLGQVLHRRCRRDQDRPRQEGDERRRQDLQGRRPRDAQRHQGPGLRGPGGHDGCHRESPPRRSS